jgi:Fe-S-cluster-containing dehydrogenase component
VGYNGESCSYVVTSRKKCMVCAACITYCVYVIFNIKMKYNSICFGVVLSKCKVFLYKIVSQELHATGEIKSNGAVPTY